MLSLFSRRSRAKRSLLRGVLRLTGTTDKRDSSSSGPTSPQHYRAVVIGGGVVGTSILYHLARNGWGDGIALLERSELTAGSTWHAAAGFHAQNRDSNMAKLQAYTIKSLYPEIERESGQNIGLKQSGGFSLAGTKERYESLKLEWAHFRSFGHETHLVTPAEIAAKCPIVDVSNVVGGLFDPSEGRCDPHGTTMAYAGAAKKRGAKIILHNRVLSMIQEREGLWRLEMENGETIKTENVVNAGGLWARNVGAMVGLNLPVAPMQHHYLITEDVPEMASLDLMPSVTDLEGFTYLQQERKGVLLGIYEQKPKHWHVRGAPWNYGMELIPEEIERISEELSIGLARFPALERVGIRKWVNGGFTFTPDGNPIVGPVRGLKGFWVAAGCMAGFSQGGGVGMSLANWVTNGDPGYDIFAMDIARYGGFASNDTYMKATTEQFYARRFVLSHPNEELPAGRPLKTTPVYDKLVSDYGARMGVTFGMEFPQYFVGKAEADSFVEIPSERRSNADHFIAQEVNATRTAAGLWETAIYARYEISGPGAAAWLDQLVASKLPAVGRVKLATLLKPNGNLQGDLSLTRFGENKFLVVASYYLQEWHQRYFHSQLPADGSVYFRNLSDDYMGFSLSGPRSRDILAAICPGEDVSNKALPFMAVRKMDCGSIADAIVARISLTGELGYEITVPTTQHRALFAALCEAGEPFGMLQIGNRALESLRHEKAYGIWNAEFTQDFTPAMSGLDRFVDFKKNVDFVGKSAVLADRADPSRVKQRLVQLSVDTSDGADARMLDPIFTSDGKLVGSVTSGSYGYHVGMSLALAYVDADIAENAPLTVYIIGEPRKARILHQPPYDPKGANLRG